MEGGMEGKAMKGERKRRGTGKEKEGRKEGKTMKEEKERERKRKGDAMGD